MHTQPHNQNDPNEVLGQRVRFVAGAMLIALSVGWIGSFYPYDDLLDRRGTPLGADFAMFYVAGQVVLDGESDRLYNQAEHQRRLLELFPAIDRSFALPYRYPPLVAALMAPLAAVPYPVAYATFFLLSCLAWWTAARCLVGVVPGLSDAWQATLWWMILSWPVALETLVGGQASMFALLIATGVYGLLRSRRYPLAGALMAAAAYKPNVLALVALACLIRYPKMLVGFIPAALIATGLCLVPNGWEGLVQYRELSTSLATQTWDVATPHWKVHGLAAWIDLLIGEGGRLVCGAVGLALTLFLALRARWLGPEKIEPMWFATLISLGALLNAYTPIYDLVLLTIGAVLTAEALVSRYGPNLGPRLVAAQVLLALFYFGPHLSQLVAKATGLQPFGLLLAAAAVWQFRWLLSSKKLNGGRTLS